jgi:hypothetical protein
LDLLSEKLGFKVSFQIRLVTPTPRVVALVQSVSDEELLMAALALNDDLSEALERQGSVGEWWRGGEDMLNPRSGVNRHSTTHHFIFPVRHFSPRYYCASKHIQSMSASAVVHVTHLTPPRSECNPVDRRDALVAAAGADPETRWGSAR